MKRLICEGENRLCAAFLAWMLFGVTEASILQIEFQLFCLLLGQMVGVRFEEQGMNLGEFKRKGVIIENEFTR